MKAVLCKEYGPPESLVLEDVKGERIGSVLRAGRPGMPPFQFTDAQVADLAEFLHSFLVSSRTGPSKIDILTGDTEKGKASSSRSVRPVTRPQRSRRLPTSSTIRRCCSRCGSCPATRVPAVAALHPFHSLRSR